ncbi:MAG TPA: 30S ribosomal protein S16 [Labilithrix sp.]|nr:30S ribosomal protein S16 [Labilithrix sp.]
MAVHIRLARAGTKKKPFYRVVVTDQRSPRGGRFLENIGTFDPAKEMKAVDGKTPFQVDPERLAHWTGRGAVPSETVGRLIKAAAKAQAAATK